MLGSWLTSHRQSRLYPMPQLLAFVPALLGWLAKIAELALRCELIEIGQGQSLGQHLRTRPPPHHLDHPRHLLGHYSTHPSRFAPCSPLPIRGSALNSISTWLCWNGSRCCRGRLLMTETDDASLFVGIAACFEIYSAHI